MLQSFDSDQSNLKSILDIENREAQKYDVMYHTKKHYKN